MADVVVLGIAGKEGLWVVDVANGTVTPLASPPSGSLGDVIALRGADVSIIKGVDFAVAVPSVNDIAQGLFE